MVGINQSIIFILEERLTIHVSLYSAHTPTLSHVIQFKGQILTFLIQFMIAILDCPNKYDYC